ncbi:MAG: hypothetical protein HFH47_02595 [Bacilli bacterium]|nr:hypothetical protein [Bacilli bacterium]
MELNKKQFKIVNEILNDIFWLGYILNLKRNINDTYKKEVLGTFLIFYSSIFADEVIKAQFGGLNKKRKITKEEIQKFRTYNLKYHHSEDSSVTQKIIKEMGIDFNNYIFDIVLIMNKNKFLDCNFRNWILEKKERFELIDGIVASPIRWVEILMPEIYEEFIANQNNLTKMHWDKINVLNINKKSYSSYKLFKNSKITSNEKIYILQRLGLVNNTLLINDILNEKITFNIGPFEFNSENFFIKTKAIIIEIFWNDKRENNSVLRKLFSLNEKTIDKQFYALNRKCRNNLHYQNYNPINKKEMIIVKHNQEIYLNNVLSLFTSYLTYNFNVSYWFWISLGKLLKHPKNKNI